jgi:four helix bundle protein
MQEKKHLLREQSIDFAIAVSNICDEIQGCSVYINQLLRSSSSIGANIHEARYAQSRADFISKLEISLKEASESEYWLELLFRKKKLSQEQYSYLRNECGSIRRKLIASITTAKANASKEHL